MASDDALIGLYLAIERGFSGPQVRDAHGYRQRQPDGPYRTSL